MNYKKLSHFFLFLPFSYHVYSMEIEPSCTSDKKSYLVYPEEYADFRLTRAYGKPLRSDFDCLPHEVIKSGIQSYLSRLVVNKFKQRLLQYGNKSSDNDNRAGSITYSLKEFPFHDGRYMLVPDIADYGMWDGRDKTFLIEQYEKEKDCHLKLISHVSPELNVRLHITQEDYLNDNRKCLKLVKGHSEGFISYNLIFAENITSYLFSNDDKWLILSCPQKAFDVAFINTKEPKKNIFICDSVVVDIAVAHHSSVCAVSEMNKVWLIITDKIERNVSLRTFFKTLFEVKATQFSPNDKHLLICGEKGLLLYEVNDLLIKKTIKPRNIFFNASIEKAFFSPDGETILIAFKDGDLLFWQDFFNKRPHNPHNARWKSNDSEDDHSPFIVWSSDSSLLISLDHHKDINSNQNVLQIFKAKNGKLLKSYASFGNGSRFVGMGFTKDDNTIIIMNKKNDLAQIKLYNEIELQNIDFIAKRAHWYQLCYLLPFIKNITTDSLLQKVQAFMEKMKL